MKLLPAALLSLFASASAYGQSDAIVLPPGTPLVVKIDEHVAMHVGEPLSGHLLYPVYANNKQVLKAGGVLNGHVESLGPDRAHRLESRLRADFTPFYVPTVRFDELVLADGTHLRIGTETVSDGAAIFRVLPETAPTGSFFHRQFVMVKGMVKDRLQVVTGPGKRDRAVQYLYTQLPYHPQRIQAGTAWTTETTEAVRLMPIAAPEAADRGSIKPASLSISTATEQPAPWLLEAYLKDAVSSGNSKVGESIQATVAQPVLGPDGSIAVPQGSVLRGTVTQARPARRFGRAGVLRFDFRELTLPDGAEQNVQTSLAGIDAPNGAQLAMDSEGKVKPKAQDKVVVPLILFALASRPLDHDGRGGDSGFGKNAVASNSLGLIGFLVGTAGGWSNVASGIGYYGTAVSLYNRWIKRGGETKFPRDTRIVVSTTARRSTLLPKTSSVRQP